MHFTYFHKIFANMICIYGYRALQELQKDILKGGFFITVGRSSVFIIQLAVQTAKLIYAKASYAHVST